jgi:hypothetical protein
MCSDSVNGLVASVVFAVKASGKAMHSSTNMLCGYLLSKQVNRHVC